MRTAENRATRPAREASPALRRAGLVVAALTLAAVAGCSGNGSDGASSSPGAGSVGSRPGLQAPAEPERAGPGAKDAAGGGAADTVAAQPDLSRRLTRTADVRLAAADVPAAAAQVRKIATDARGYLSDERTTTGRPGPDQPVPTEPLPAEPGPGGNEPDGNEPDDVRSTAVTSVLTLQVPTAALDRVLQRVAAVGKVLSQGQTTQDVTGEYVDTTSRIANQEASVARVRALLARADNLGEVVQIEGELTRRQADLESLQTRLEQLKDQTTLSTLTVSISEPAKPAADPGIDRGFLGGLAAGWRALIGGLGLALTVLGALLPFAVLTALMGAPLVLWVRRRRRAQPAS